MEAYKLVFIANILIFINTGKYQSKVIVVFATLRLVNQEMNANC